MITRTRKSNRLTPHSPGRRLAARHSRAWSAQIEKRKRAEAALRDMEKQYRLIAENTSDVIWVRDLNLQLTFISPSVTWLLGYSVPEAMRQSLAEAFTSDAAAAATRFFAEMLSEAQQRPPEQLVLHSWVLELEANHKNGSTVWVELSMNFILDADGKPSGILGITRDITERKQSIHVLSKLTRELETRVQERTEELSHANDQLVHAMSERDRIEHALRESEERYALAARGANDGLWDWDLQTNRFYYSPRWKAMLGYSDDEIGDDPADWFDRIHPEDVERVTAEIKTHLENQSADFKSEYQIKHQDGSWLWVLSRGIAVRDMHGIAVRLVGSQTDITSRKRAEEQLLHDAFHDALTGLPNRALFIDRLGRVMERAKRLRNYGFAVLHLDLDRFKWVNDCLGHLAGDQLLSISACRMGMCLRSVDTVARLGGDEFVILLEDVFSPQMAIQLAERIQNELMLPFDLNGHRVVTSASIGIVKSDNVPERPEDVLRDAEIAMYHAKALGRARHVLFDSTMLDSAVARLELESDLRGAIERDELQIHYQPIAALENKKITGFEALVRWQHPTRGLVPPTEFIPAAEETGLILELGRWVLRNACRQMHEWHVRFPANPPLTISVNLSTKQFAQPNLIEQIKEILAETELDPHCLKLEITESAIMGDSQSAAAMLSQLQAMGVEVQIDDFGTGYSSLSYLQQFPIDTLKIDRSFVSRMSASGKNNGAEIVRTIVMLARELGIKVVAEGVETSDQLSKLKGLKCNYGQGFLFSKPLERAQVETIIGDMSGSAHSKGWNLKSGVVANFQPLLGFFL